MMSLAGLAVGAGAKSGRPAGRHRRRGWAVRLLRYCWRRPGPLLAVLAGTLVSAAAIVAVPLIQRDIVNNAILAHRQPAWAGAVALTAAAALSFAGASMRSYLGGRLSLDVQHDVRTEMFASLASLDGHGQDQLSTGQVVGRSTSDLNMVQGLVAAVPLAAGSILLFIGSLIAMLVISPLLTVVALVVAPALIGISVVSRGKVLAASREAQQRTASLVDAVNGAVAGVRVVKGFGQEDQEVARVADVSTLLYAARVRMLQLVARYNPLLQATPALGQIGVLAYGGYLALNGRLSVGTLLAFSAYLAMLIGPLKTTAGMIPLLQEAQAGVIRVFEVIDARPVVTERPDAMALVPGSHDIQLDEVVFGYQPPEMVLRGLSLRVGAGETVAITGTSGSGKSTISWLLSRFYDVRAGAVRIGGHDVRDLTIDSLRASIGLVTQESFLFSGTIRENICYARQDATDQLVRSAARMAGADEFIRELPDGYQTVIGEQGMTLSGGQRQRLALARVLITDPAILVLDDATSALDAPLETRVHQALRRAAPMRTTVLIAHRRSALRFADKIAVLDEGRLADFGTHDELTARCPLYRDLLARPDGQAEPDPPGPLAAPVPAPAPAAAPQPAARATAAMPDTGAGEGAAAPFSLGRLLRPVAVILLAGLVLDALDVIAGIAVPWLMRSGIDHGIAARALPYIFTVSGVCLAVVLADWGVNVAQTMLMGRVGERLLYTLRVSVFARLQRLGLDFYEREMTGRIVTRMTTDVGAMSAFLQTGLITMINSALTLAGVVTAVLLIDAWLGLVLVSVLPVFAAATAVFMIKTAGAYAEARERAGTVNAGLQENVAGLRVIQNSRRERLNSASFAGLSQAYLTSRLRAQRYIALYFPFVQALAVIASALVLLAGAGAVRAGTLTIGSLIAYLLYIDLLFAPILQISQSFDGYRQARVGVARIAELFRIPESTPEASCPVPAGRLRGEVEFAGVQFGYPAAAQQAVEGIDLRIAPGETVALVGHSGAGKSTLVKLVARFYDVTRGRVLVDGVDVREYDLRSYRRQLGVVPQESYLFGETVRDAIGYGRPTAADSEIEDAARSAGAAEMISRLPGGFGHAVTEGGRNLSAGQRQLIALARACLVDPAILLLDEATAALDPAAEAEVARAFEQLTAKRTTLVVAHRLTTAARADRIIVLDSGRIAEVGTHDELVAAAGRYAELWAAALAQA